MRPNRRLTAADPSGRADPAGRAPQAHLRSQQFPVQNINIFENSGFQSRHSLRYLLNIFGLGIIVIILRLKPIFIPATAINRNIALRNWVRKLVKAQTYD